MRRRHILLLLVAMMLAILGMARTAQAQDEAEPEKEQPAEAELQFQMTDEQFEQWIFGKDLERGTKASPISPRLGDQSGRSDVPAHAGSEEEAGGRRTRRHEAALRSLSRSEGAAPSRRGDFNQIGPILQELQAFQQAPHAYLFGDESMLAKTLKKTLTPEQIAAHEKDVYRSRVEWMVSLLDKALGLKAEQHRRFVTLIVEETPPLKRYGSFDYDAVMFQASRLPQDKIKPIFDDAQLTKLLVRFGQARRMETILFGEGYLPARRPGAERIRRGGRRLETRRRPRIERSEGLLIGAGQTRRD